MAAAVPPPIDARRNLDATMTDPVPADGASEAGSAGVRFRSVIEGYAPRLVRFLEMRTGNGSDAQDLAQEAYFRLCRVSDPDLIREPESYLFRIACNLANELALRRGSQPAMVELDAGLPDLADGDSGSFADLLESRSSVERLESILAEMPSLYRAVLVLRKRDGYTHDEIAERLGISPHTVHKYLSRALFQCRALWAERHHE